MSNNKNKKNQAKKTTKKKQFHTLRLKYKNNKDTDLMILFGQIWYIQL